MFNNNSEIMSIIYNKKMFSIYNLSAKTSKNKFFNGLSIFCL